MEKTSMIFFKGLVVSLFVVLPPENNLPKVMSEKGNESQLIIQDKISDQSIMDPIIFDDFEFLEGIEIRDLTGVGGSYDRRRVFQLSEGSLTGRVEDYFFDQSAKYDITLFYVDGLRRKSSGKSVVSIIINGRNIANIILGSSNSFKEKFIPGINIQQWSKIELEFIGDGVEKCRVEKIVFTYTGTYEGKIWNLAEPKSLRIFTTGKERQMARRIFSDFVQAKIDTIMEKRRAELALLKTPDEWRARQKQTREQLYKYFGEFPERTPLNSKTLDKIDRDGYIIEKVIFESQPNYYVSANLYIPKGREFPLPGVVFPCGHSDDAKARDVYHMSGLGFVHKGYVTLVFDPIGQGERSEYFDVNTRQPLVRKGVDQHHYVGRPAFLTDWSLSGLRTWDCIRAVDYLVSRPEVDSSRLVAAGCSGGGQMTMLITAVDERIKACAVSHPGGPYENSYLTSRELGDREIYSLIPPRPIRIIVGNESGEEPGHRRKLDDMQLFYEGLRAGKQTGELDMVPGIHSMNRSNRESAYEWINKWLDREAEGKAEAVLKPEKTETLWCTQTGHTIISLGGETGQTLNAKRAERIYKPEMNLVSLKERIASRIGLTLPVNRQKPGIYYYDTLTYEDLTVEKLTYESENGIIIPALIIKPQHLKPGSPVYLYASDNGKPARFENSLLPFLLAKNGVIVLAIDVRGIGETSPTPKYYVNQYTGYTPLLWRNDILAMQCTGLDRTTLGMRVLDMIKAVDFLKSHYDLKGRKIVTVGEGLGGLFALLTSVYDPSITGTVTVGTLPSYKLLITSKYYNVWGYFFVPGALRDFDIPDLCRAVSPKPQVWINPVNALGEKLNSSDASSIIGTHKNLHIMTLDEKSSVEFIKQVITIFN